jgi:hypothetical protein
MWTYVKIGKIGKGFVEYVENSVFEDISSWAHALLSLNNGYFI